MEMLHDDLAAISAALAGSKVLVRGTEYNFSKFRLDTQRIPPIADGYVLHLRLSVDAWKLENYKDMYGRERQHQAGYSFRPTDVSFSSDQEAPQE